MAITWPMPLTIQPGPFQYPTSQWGQSAASPKTRIVYIDDTHNKQHLPLASGFGTVFQTESQKAVQTGEDLLAFSAGDFHIGKKLEDAQLNVALLNWVQRQVQQNGGQLFATFGNHEFDVSTSDLATALQRSQYPYIATNLYLPNTSSLNPRFQEKRVITGPLVYRSPRNVTYGIVGVTVPSLTDISNPDTPREGVGSQNKQDSLARVAKDVAWLQQQGIQRIILVSHAGFQTDQEIAQTIPGIDIIIGGHSHTPIDGINPGYNYVTGPTGEPVTIVQCGKDTKAGPGVLEVSWDQYGRAIPLHNTLFDPHLMPRSQAVEAIVSQHKGPAKVIGVLAHDIETENASSGGPNAVAHKIADILHERTQLDPQIKADITFFRGNGLRNDLYKGPITDRDVQLLLPFQDNWAAFKMTGKDVMAVLEESARCVKEHENHPGMVHPSGIRYTMDQQTGQVSNVLVWDKSQRQWLPLNLNQSYTVTVDSFMAKNKKEYPIFKQVPLIKEYDFNSGKAFSDFIRSQRGLPVSFRLDERVTVTNVAPKNQTQTTIEQAMYQRAKSNSLAAASLYQPYATHTSNQWAAWA